jgi:hypothetical protein
MMEIVHRPFTQAIPLFPMGDQRDDFCTTPPKELHHDRGSTDPVHIVIAKETDWDPGTHRLRKDLRRRQNGSYGIGKGEIMEPAKKMAVDLLVSVPFESLEGKGCYNGVDPERTGKTGNFIRIGEGTGSPYPFSELTDHLRFRSRKRTIGLAM